MDGSFLADTFTVCAEASQIARYLMDEDPEGRFTFASQSRIAYLLQQPALMFKGDNVAAYIAVAAVQGSNRLLWSFLASQFDPERNELEFLVYLDAAHWQAFGRSQETGPSGFPIEREALIYHELCHLRHLQTKDGAPRYHDDGRELLALARHTYEFFDDEIRRYGPITTGLEQVGIDYVVGAKAEKSRRQSGLKKSA